MQSISFLTMRQNGESETKALLGGCGHKFKLLYSYDVILKSISASLRSTTWIEKPLGLFWLFRPSTADITIRYTTSSITFKHVVEKLEQSWATVYTEYCQNRGQKKPAGKNLSREKNSAGNLGRIHGSCSEKPILRRLHGWKDFALIYKTSIPTKDGKL